MPDPRPSRSRPWLRAVLVLAVVGAALLLWSPWTGWRDATSSPARRPGPDAVAAAGDPAAGAIRTEIPPAAAPPPIPLVVRGAESRQTVADAVVIEWTGTLAAPETVQVVRSDADGTCRLAALRPASSLVAYHRQHAITSIDPAVAQSNGIIELRPRPVVHCRVLQESPAVLAQHELYTAFRLPLKGLVPLVKRHERRGLEEMVRWTGDTGVAHAPTYEPIDVLVMASRVWPATPEPIRRSVAMAQSRLDPVLARNDVTVVFQAPIPDQYSPLRVEILVPFPEPAEVEVQIRGPLLAPDISPSPVHSMVWFTQGRTGEWITVTADEVPHGDYVCQAIMLGRGGMYGLGTLRFRGEESLRIEGPHEYVRQRVRVWRPTQAQTVIVSVAAADGWLVENWVLEDSAWPDGEDCAERTFLLPAGQRHLVWAEEHGGSRAIPRVVAPMAAESPVLLRDWRSQQKIGLDLQGPPRPVDARPEFTWFHIEDLGSGVTWETPPTFALRFSGLPLCEGRYAIRIGGRTGLGQAQTVTVPVPEGRVTLWR